MWAAKTKTALLGGEQFFVEAHFLMRGRRHRSTFFLLAAGREAAKGSSPRDASSGQAARHARPKGLALTRTEADTLAHAVQDETSACTAWRPRFAFGEPPLRGGGREGQADGAGKE